MQNYVDFAGPARTLPLFVVEWLIVFIGVLGNVLVVILIVFYDGIKKPVNKILFVNLAVADLGFLLIRHSFNFVEMYYSPYSPLTAFSCEVLEPISMAFFPVSLLTIMTISYYRYQGIVQLGLSELSVKKTIFIVGVIWTTTLVFYPIRRIPFSKLSKNAEKVCQLVLPETIVITVRLVEITMFVLVIIVTFILFLKMRRTLINSSRFNSSLRIALRISQNLKTLRVLKPVVLILFLTVSPISTVDILRIVNFESIKLVVVDFRDYLLMYHLFAVLMLINSSANPFIYAFASREFRTSLRKLFNFRCGRKHPVSPLPQNSGAP